jgi:adenylosuccinate synthase
MSVRIIIGAQWGDEGKGKIVDMLSDKVSWVARYQGGANAGHTLKIEGRTFVLHLVPSGIFHPHVHCVIGNGAVIDPGALIEEINAIKELGVEVDGRLTVSETAHVILKYHKVLDHARERYKGDQKIGTTGRGIGPAYVHKTARMGIRMMDLVDPDGLREKIYTNVDDINAILATLSHAPIQDADDILREALDWGDQLRPFLADAGKMLHTAWKKGDNLLLEGAQGSLLDVDHGTYPYVTSSSPTSGGACIGTGLPPTSITHVMGIAKAYCTRVGNGPFPTELFGETGDRIREIGHEFGATTGRPRRCGWIDLVALSYAVRINGINELAITKLDVLDSFDEIKLCTAYRMNGIQTADFPLRLSDFDLIEPIYATLPGWQQSTRECASVDDVPVNMAGFIKFIEGYLEVPVRILSTGPGRNETLVVGDLS